jgi:hypothetical protein
MHGRSGPFQAHPDLPGGKAILAETHAYLRFFQVAIAPKDAGVPCCFETVYPLPTGKGL